ncbi:MAG: hypothetical protein RI955_204 [Bacteroidota bacterium]
MKKIFYTALFFAISFNSFSQITIHNTDVQKGGDIFKLSSQTTNITSIDPKPTGANYNWDYSTLVADAQVMDTFLTTSQVPFTYSLYFFGYNLAQNAPDLNLGIVSISSICNMYKNSSTTYDFWGYGGNISGIPLPFNCTPHDVIYKFPMNYGNMDSTDSKLTAAIPNLLSFTQYRHRVNQVDGWGSLRTPKGIFNCLRLKSFVHDMDSIKLDTAFTHLPFALNLGIPQTTIEYKWLVAGQGDPLLQINQTAALIGAPTTSLVRWQNDSTYIPPAPNGFENILNEHGLQIFPNPANLFCSLVNENGFKNADVLLTDITGRTLQHQYIKDQQVVYLSTYNLANGIYFISLKENDNLISRKKLIVQH